MSGGDGSAPDVALHPPTSITSTILDKPLRRRGLCAVAVGFTDDVLPDDGVPGNQSALQRRWAGIVSFLQSVAVTG
jgi:hypothetical protein